MYIKFSNINQIFNLNVVSDTCGCLKTQIYSRDRMTFSRLMIGCGLEVIFSCCTKQQLQEERYLNSPCLKQDSLDIERKETGKSLKDLGMDICIYFFLLSSTIIIRPAQL